MFCCFSSLIIFGSVPSSPPPSLQPWFKPSSLSFRLLPQLRTEFLGFILAVLSSPVLTLFPLPPHIAVCHPSDLISVTCVEVACSVWDNSLASYLLPLLVWFYIAFPIPFPHNSSSFWRQIPQYWPAALGEGAEVRLMCQTDQVHHSRSSPLLSFYPFWASRKF